MSAPIAANEAARLEALRKYAILDTPSEAAFERLTRLAARLLDVPISLLSLVDEDRQWFKSTYGFKRKETPREISFCAHAILADTVMVVPDASRDARFETNELVTTDPGIRFYAGAPLCTPDGLNLGTLCALDTEPRDFTPEEQQVLADLAALAMDELQLRVALREKSQHLAAIEHLRAGVIVTDPNLPDNPIIFSNPGFTAVTGYMPEEILGRNCRFLQGPETDPEVVEEIRAAMKQRRLFNGVVRNHRSTGEGFWNDLTITPVFDENGQLTSFVGLQRDITPIKEAQEQLQQANAELRKLQEMRDNLTHMIVHDLRSPLAGVIGYLDLLKSRGASSMAQKEFRWVQSAFESADRLNEMITSLLDTNRLENGEMPLNLARHDLVELAGNALDSLAPVFKKRRQIRKFPSQAALTECDGDLVSRVLCNLVSNALKFTPADGEIRTEISVDDGSIRVAVTDNGPGIAPEFHTKIFEKFGQLESETKHSTGLGLTFCKLAVEAQGGSIGVSSEPGAGSTFWFTLPRLRDDSNGA